MLGVKHLQLELFLLQDDVLLLVLEFEAVQVVDEVSVLLGLDVVLDADASLVLAGVGPQRSDGALHVVQLLVEFFDGLGVALLALVLVGNLTLDVVLVELHEASDVALLVPQLHDLLHVLRKFEDDCLLLLCLLLLPRDFNRLLVDLGLVLPQLLAVGGDPLVLILEVLLQLEQLILQVVNLLLFRLQARAHFLSSMRQDMLRLPQVLYLELVLVEVRLSLLQLLDLLQLALLLMGNLALLRE